MSENTSYLAFSKLLAVSCIEIFIFFVPVELNGKSTILLDHGSEWILSTMRPLALTFIMLLMCYGGLSPFLMVQCRFRGLIPIIHIAAKNSFTHVGGAIFSLLKLFGLLLSLLYLTQKAPEWMLRSDMLPFLFEKLAMAVGILIPLGSLALTFLIGFGLLEMAGVLMEKVMRPLFRTPGYSAVDAVTSFVGSYSIGLLITNRMYLRGRYSLRDAVITATGFSRVSATFMVVVAKTLGLMDHWNFYFWSTFLVTFVTTSITAYLPPIAGMDTQYGAGKDEKVESKLLQHAIRAGVRHYLRRPPLTKMLWDHLKEGLVMSAVVVPSILAVGFLGICVAKYTPLFDWLGYLLKPVLMLAGMLLNVENASAASGAIASGLAEMFLPAILLKDYGEIALRFIAAMTSVSSVLFFSGCIPCILATQIPVKMRDLLLIWLLRTLLSILLSSIMVWIGLQAGWI